MDGATILRLLPTLILLVLSPKPMVQTKWLPHHPHPLPPPAKNPPLCAAQYSLANRACSTLPYKWVPPPSPPSSPAPTSPLKVWEGGPRHKHKHGLRQVHNETAAQEDCCHWLNEIDDVCVCELLVHLPTFLTRPAHNYTVVVGEACEVTFRCGSRLLQL
ncbi:hypothetical protein OROMI_015776 [Orobanche minor]